MKTEAEKRKLKKRRIVGLLIALGVIVFLCELAACWAFVSIPSTELRPTSTWAPIPTLPATPQPTANPTTELYVCDPCPTCEVCEVCPTEMSAPTPAPVTEPVVFEGSGEVVTDNLRLSACQKSVFSWRHGGTSNFFVDLCGVSCKSLIIAGRDDTTGEAFQPLEGGGYYLVVESVEGPWTVTWECRD